MKLKCPNCNSYTLSEVSLTEHFAQMGKNVISLATPFGFIQQSMKIGRAIKNFWDYGTDSDNKFVSQKDAYKCSHCKFYFTRCPKCETLLNAGYENPDIDSKIYLTN